MITFRNKFFGHRPTIDHTEAFDTGFGNLLFWIAGTIGIAVKNGYEYTFPAWNNRQFFTHPLPESVIDESRYQEFDIPWGFHGFDVPDNVTIFGFMQTDKYFAHCGDLIRYYFELKPPVGIKPYEDCILMHYRNYKHPWFVDLGREYYLEALKHLPDRHVVIVTDNITEARKAIGGDFEYVSNTPWVDFYLLSKADYIVIGNSSFSWWGAWLSRAVTVAPSRWFTDELPQSTEDFYCENWLKV
jgi:hypothetical protein